MLRRWCWGIWGLVVVSLRQLALDWLAQPEGGALVLVTVPGRNLFVPGALFLFLSVGAAFPPCRGFVSFFLPSSLAVLPPPFYHPASGFIGAPPEVRYGI